MGNSVSSLGNVGGGLFKQMGIQPLNSQYKATGNYASGSGYQNMMQRLYGGNGMIPQGGYMSGVLNNIQPVFNTSKSVAQPSSVTNPFATYRSMNMMPYWMALTRRFMGY